MKALLSVKPHFVEEMISGAKKYEYRKRVFKRPDVSSVIVYATKPCGKVVGEFEIEEIIEEEIDDLWRDTRDLSGISEEFFYEYFHGRKIGFAIKIRNFIAYDRPLDLAEIDSRLKVPPQSFCYVSKQRE